MKANHRYCSILSVLAILLAIVNVQADPGKAALIFNGNPGVGKSFLLNSIAKYIGRGDNLFQSGLSKDGAGVTMDVQMEDLGRFIGLDVPGLFDPAKFDHCKAMINEALKRQGNYKIVFVLQFINGRVQAQDVAAMAAALSGLEDKEGDIANRFGIVFNQLTKQDMRAMTNPETANLKIATLVNALEKALKKPVGIPTYTLIPDETNHGVEDGSISHLSEDTTKKLLTFLERVSVTTLNEGEHRGVQDALEEIEAQAEAIKEELFLEKELKGEEKEKFEEKLRIKQKRLEEAQRNHNDGSGGILGTLIQGVTRVIVAVIQKS